jgi:hypothetical protein
MIAGLIPDEAIGLSNWPNPSSCTMAMELPQPLTEMSTRNLPGGKGWPALENVKLENVGPLTSHNPMGLHSLLQR